MNNRTKRLRQIMAKHKLTANQVAGILGRTQQTVRMWRVGTPRTIPEHALELLEFKLGER